MKNIFITVLLIFLHILIFGQNTNSSWKKISVDDFDKSKYADFTNSNAIVLEESVDMYFGVWNDDLRLFYDVYQRIEILNDDGLKYSKIEIPYTGFEDFEIVTSISGFTYNIENKTIKKSKLKIQNILTEGTKNDFDCKKIIELPDVKSGSIIEYKYTIATLNFTEPETFYFQKEIPVLISQFTANIPNFITYDFLIIGTSNLATSEIVEGQTHLNWIFENKDPIPSGSVYKSKDFTAPMNMNFVSNYYKFVMKNMDAYTPENYVDNYKNYLYKISPQLVKVTQDIGYYSYIQLLAWKDLSKRMYQTTENNYQILNENVSDFRTYPAGYVLYNTKTWNILASDLLASKTFGLQFIKFWNYKPFLNEILKNKNSETEKLEAIYKFVKDTIKWNTEYSVLPKNSIEDIYKNKQGNSAEINSLLLFLLNKADFEVYPVLISTRSNGKIDTISPSLKKFNHLIVAVKTKNETIFIDAVNNKLPFDLLNFEDLNGEGFLLKRNDSKWIEIENSKISKQINIDTIYLNPDNLETNHLQQNFGYYAFSDSTNIQNLEPYVKQQNSSTPILEKNYIKLKPFETYENLKNPFIDNIRNYPVNFGYPFQEIIKQTIIFDKNLAVIRTPDNFILQTVNNEASIQFKILQNENKLEIEIILNINKSEFDGNKYLELKEIFENYEKISEFVIIFEK